MYMKVCYIFGRNMYEKGYIDNDEYYLIEDVSNCDMKVPMSIYKMKQKAIYAKRIWKKKENEINERRKNM